MLKIIHISDTHIAPAGRMVVGLDPCSRLRQVVRAINEDHTDAALCVFTGDLTDRGETEAYETFAAILEDLNVPQRLLLGNHDNRAAFRQVFPAEPVDESGFVQSFEDFGEIRLVFLDTLDDDNPSWGRMCQKRMALLDRALAGTEKKRTLIFMHHPPFSVGVPIFEKMLLNEPATFLSRIAESDSVSHIAFGHLHLTTTGVWHRIPFSCNRGVCHHIALNSRPGSTDFLDTEPTFDVISISETGTLVHSTTAVTPADIIAREFPTEDGRGRIELAHNMLPESLSLKQISQFHAD